MIRIAKIAKIDKKVRDLILLKRLEEKLKEMKKEQATLAIAGGAK